MSANVSHVTEKAAVTFDPSTTTVDEIITKIVKLGFGASELKPDAEADEGAEDASPFRSRLILSAPLAVPVIALSMIPAWRFDGWQWIGLLLTTPVATWGAWPLHRGAWAALKHRTATMDTLVSLGIGVSYLWSLIVLLAYGPEPVGEMMDGATRRPPEFLEVSAALTVLVLAGRLLEAAARRRGSEALRGLLKQDTVFANVLRDGGEVRVPAAQVGVGEYVVVRPGEQVPVDGEVVEGASALDTAALTGESVPIETVPGDQVTGGAVNVGGRIVVRADRVGADTTMAQAAKLLAEAQAGKASIQRLADRIASVFVPAVITLSFLTLVGRMLVGQGASTAIEAAVAVLVVSCPCALGLATPAALAAGVGRGAQMGIFVRGPRVLEATRTIDTVVLDKTGTVTTGKMTVVGFACEHGVAPAEALRLAGAVEDASEHPIARAIVAEAVDYIGTLPPVTDLTVAHGQGVSGVVEGRLVAIGQPALFAGLGFHIPDSLMAARAAAESRGHTAVMVGWDGRACAVIGVTDPVRPGSGAAIRRLHNLGLRTVLLTGDNESVAKRVGGQVGIDSVIAGVLPAGKVEAVKDLKSRGRQVAMTGDGVNDAAALATADLGLALGSGTDLARRASDIILVRADLHAAADAIILARRMLRIIRQNLAWAFGYNLLMIPAAVAGAVDPMFAGAAMAFSSLTVSGNALRLRRFSPPGSRRAPRSHRLRQNEHRQHPGSHHQSGQHRHRGGAGRQGQPATQR